MAEVVVGCLLTGLMGVSVIIALVAYFVSSQSRHRQDQLDRARPAVTSMRARGRNKASQ